MGVRGVRQGTVPDSLMTPPSTFLHIPLFYSLLCFLFGVSLGLMLSYKTCANDACSDLELTNLMSVYLTSQRIVLLFICVIYKQENMLSLFKISVPFLYYTLLCDHNINLNVLYIAQHCDNVSGGFCCLKCLPTCVSEGSTWTSGPGRPTRPLWHSWVRRHRCEYPHRFAQRICHKDHHCAGEIPTLRYPTVLKSYQQRALQMKTQRHKRALFPAERGGL